jgi:bifunctional DNA-binding transcriptional regulator/antitoxin component of YhaV-PrlF toxin-antitoxin module
MATATIEKDGRVRVPRQVLRLLGVDAGDQLSFEVVDGQVVVSGEHVDIRGLRGAAQPRHTNITISGMQLAIRLPNDPDDEGASR